MSHVCKVSRQSSTSDLKVYRVLVVLSKKTFLVLTIVQIVSLINHSLKN